MPKNSAEVRLRSSILAMSVRRVICSRSDLERPFSAAEHRHAYAVAVRGLDQPATLIHENALPLVFHISEAGRAGLPR